MAEVVPPIPAEQMEWFREHWALADKHKVIASHEALRAQVEELTADRYRLRDRVATELLNREAAERENTALREILADLLAHTSGPKAVPIRARARAVLAAVPDHE